MASGKTLLLTFLLDRKKKKVKFNRVIILAALNVCEFSQCGQ